MIINSIKLMTIELVGMTRVHIPSHKLKALLSKDIQAYDKRESDDNIVIFKPSPYTPNHKDRFRKSRAKIIPFDSYKASKL